MLKPILRTKSIGTKVTEEEYARLEALAGTSGRNMSEWVRDVLLAELESKSAEGTEATLLAELRGLRTILLNLLFTLAKGEVMTDDQMQTLIERADAGKLEPAAKTARRACSHGAGAAARDEGAVMSQWVRAGRAVIRYGPSGLF
jgi:hypothetical protein